MNGERREVSIIIVNWNSSEYLGACLQSIKKETVSLSYEVVVVDNSCEAECQELLWQQFPEVLYIKSRENIGFASANNLGAKMAQAPILLFLNPDTIVVNRAIERLHGLHRCLERPGVIGCRLVDSAGKVQDNCVQAFPNILNQVCDAKLARVVLPRLRIWGNSMLWEESDRRYVEVEAVSGACMMISREVFRRVGGFTEDYFMYTEDVDLCFKVCRAGFTNYFCRDVTIVHFGGGSSQKALHLLPRLEMYQGKEKFFERYYGRLYSKMYKALLAVGALLRVTVLTGMLPVACGRTRLKVRKALCAWVEIARWCWGHKKGD